MNTETIEVCDTAPAIVTCETRVIVARPVCRSHAGVTPSPSITGAWGAAHIVREAPAFAPAPAHLDEIRATLTARAWRGDESGVWGLLVRDAEDVRDTAPAVTDADIEECLAGMGW